MRTSGWKEGGPDKKKKLLVCFGDRLAEENYQYSVIYILSIKETTSLLLKKKAYLYLTWVMEWMRIDAILNFIGLNLLISVTT